MKSKKKVRQSGPPSIPDVDPGIENAKVTVDIYEYEPDEEMKKQAQAIRLSKG